MQHSFLKKYVFTAAMLLAVYGALSAQDPGQYTVTAYTSGQGLAGNEVVKTVTDKKGFLWVATHNGISRFNGQSFKNFTCIPGDTSTLRSIWVTDLTLDADSMVWATTEWGLCYYDELFDRFRYIHPREQFTILYKAPVLSDNRGVLWMAAENGLYKINTRTKKYEATPLTRIADPQSIAQDANGLIMIGTRGDGLYFYNPVDGRVQKLHHPAVPAQTHFMSILVHDTAVWVASDAGLIRVNNSSQAAVFTSAAPGVTTAAPKQLMDILPVNMNNRTFFLCGTYNKGLILFDPEKKAFSPPMAASGGAALFPSGTAIYDVYSSGNIIWVSAQTGLYKIAMAPGPFSQITLPVKTKKGEPLMVQHMLPDNTRKHIYWIFSEQDDGTLLQYDTQKKAVIKKMYGHTSFGGMNDNISALLQDDAGTVYTFADKYINMFSAGGQWKKEINTGKIITCAGLDSAGNIWMGTADGIATYNLKNNELKIFDCSFTGTDVERTSYWQPFAASGITCKDTSLVWVTSIKYGLFLFNRQTRKFTPYRQPFKGQYETLNRCSSVTLGGDTVWLGTMAGLTAFVPAQQKFINYNSSHGLRSAYVYSVSRAAPGLLWGRGNEGVFYFDCATGKFVNYVLPDPFSISYYLQKVHAAGNQCLLGLQGQFAVFETRQNNPAPVTAVLNSISAENKIVIPAIDNKLPRLQLAYNQNDVRIDFTAVNFSEEPVFYQYRLLGLDDDWTDGGKINQANYSNLAPANYVFQVKCRKGEEAWGPVTNLVEINIAAAFWQRLWFKLLAVAWVLGIFVVLYLLRIKQLSKQQKEQNKLQQLQLKQYRQQLEMEQIINYFTSSLSSKNTKEEVIWDVAKNLIQQLGFANCMIYLWNDDKTVLLQKAGYGPNGSLETVVKEPFNVKPWQGIVGHVAATKKAILLGDTSKDPRYRPDVLTRFSELCVPALYNDELISVIDSEDYAKDYYTPQHLQILTTIATLMAARLVAIETAGDIQRKKEEINKMNEQVAQLELASLRSQMNPHFIFNSLNSVQKYIWENKEEDAAEYLASFARLMRSILENSRHQYIALSKEMAFLKLYIELECRRSNNGFNYQVRLDESLDADAVQMPPMLLQPFIENAIWHGLNKKQVKGNLLVHIYQQDTRLVCVVDDDGAGRSKQPDTAAEKKSLGISITRQRIERMTESTNKTASVTIRDKVENNRAAGTEVTVILPLQTATRHA